MVRLIVCLLIFSISSISIVYSQSDIKPALLPVSTKAAFKQMASKYRTGEINPTTIEKEIKASGLDLGQMSVEDAVMYMFMLISDDARNDMKALMNEMDATRKKKEDMRAAQNNAKAKQDSLRNKARATYNQEFNLASAKEQQLEQQKTAAEHHLKSVEDAIRNLQRKRHQ